MVIVGPFISIRNEWRLAPKKSIYRRTRHNAQKKADEASSAILLFGVCRAWKLMASDISSLTNEDRSLKKKKPLKMKVAMFLFFFKFVDSPSWNCLVIKTCQPLVKNRVWAYMRTARLHLQGWIWKKIYIYHTLIILFTSLYNNLCDKYIQMKEVKMSNVHNKYNFVFLFCV